MAGTAILLIIFCIGVFALLAWFAVTMTSENGVKKMANVVTKTDEVNFEKSYNSSGTGRSSIFPSTTDPANSIYASNIWHSDD